MTVAELGRRVSSSELMEWAAFYRLEPFGPARDNMHAGLICATVAGASGRCRRQPSPSDYMLDSEAQQQVDNDPDQKAAKAAFKHFAKLFGNKVD